MTQPNIELERTVASASSIPSFREVQDGGTSWSMGSGGSEMPPVNLTTLSLNLRLTALTDGAIISRFTHLPTKPLAAGDVSL